MCNNKKSKSKFIFGLFFLFLIINGCCGSYNYGLIKGYTNLKDNLIEDIVWEKYGYEFISTLFVHTEEKGEFYIQLYHPNKTYSGEKNVYMSKIFTRSYGVKKKSL